MGRNRLAGTKTGKSRSALYYQTHPEARNKKKNYDTKYHSTPSRKKYRALLQAINKKNGTHANLDHKDVAHTSKTKTVSQSQSKNRGDKIRKFFK
jgi:hypothetical protein